MNVLDELRSRIKEWNVKAMSRAMSGQTKKTGKLGSLKFDVGDVITLGSSETEWTVDGIGGMFVSLVSDGGKAKLFLNMRSGKEYWLEGPSGSRDGEYDSKNISFS